MQQVMQFINRHLVCHHIYRLKNILKTEDEVFKDYKSVPTDTSMFSFSDFSRQFYQHLLLIAINLVLHELPVFRKTLTYKYLKRMTCFMHSTHVFTNGDTPMTN